MNYVIIGCGSLGAELALALRRGGHAMVLVDKDQETLHQVDPSLRGVAIVGSGLDRQILIQAGIEQADGLAAVTSCDETNVILARLARHVFHVPRVVARLHDPRKAELYRRLGIQSEAPLDWAAKRLADLLSYSEVDAMMSLGNGQVEIVRVEVSPLMEGRKVGSIAIPGEIQVVALSRRGKTMLPSPETTFQRNDSVHLAVAAESSERLRALLDLG